MLQRAQGLGVRAAAPLNAFARAQSSTAPLLDAVFDGDSRAVEWERAKPFHAIPGPKPYPLLGNLPRLLPGIGEYGKKDLLHMQVKLRERYGDIVRVSDIKGQKDRLYLFDPKYIEKVFRNEGKWPIRGGIKTLHYYRTVVRKEKYEGALGTITSQGKEWQDFRSKVNQPLMQPRSVLPYFVAIDGVAEEFIGRIRSLLDKNKELPPDFMNEVYKWSLESIALVALDTRLGCLSPNLQPDSEPQRMIDAVQVILEGFYKLDMKPSLWHIVSTPMWRRLVKAFDYFFDVSEKYINEAIARQGNDPNRAPSILDRLMTEDPRVAKVMASDMLFGGVDTTSHTSMVLLFHLAKNPEVQRKLGDELERALPSKETPITQDAMAQMPYLKACLKETFRLYPIIVSLMRETPKDIVLGDYQVPQGVDLFLGHMVMCRDEQFFPRPLSFEPERWLRQEGAALDFNPFLSLPFGFGVRTCVGKRFAELEVLTLAAKILRNFWVEYHHGDELKFEARIINTITSPLKFRLMDKES